MFVGGAPDTGKTTLQRYYQQTVPSRVFDGRKTIPVLMTRAPARGTEKKLVSAMLRSIGDPAAEFGTADEQTARLLQFMDDFMVELVFIDEFQQFVDKDNTKVLQNQCDWLKDLIDSSRRAVVLCGMPWAIRILEKPENEQLGRRIPIRKELSPFSWDTEDKKTAFRAFLKKVDDQLPLPARSRLASMSMSYRFFCATNGRVGKIMRLVRRAAEIAVREEMQSLDLPVLARAYNERLMADRPALANPFSVQSDSLKPIPFTEYVPDFNRTSKRRGGNRKETASSVLRK
jgi:hypothetical protein